LKHISSHLIKLTGEWLLTRGHSSELHRQACTVTDWFTCSSNTTVFPLMFWCLDLTHRFRYVSAQKFSLSSPPINHPYYAMLCYVTPLTSLFFSYHLFSYHAMLCYVTPTPISNFLHEINMYYVCMCGIGMNWTEWWSQNYNDYHDDLWIHG